MKRYFLALVVALLLQACQSAPIVYSVGQITTPQGEILVWLYSDTPNHKQAFLQLAQEHYWDSYTFNRVINGFVIQGGCPDTPEGFADSPHLLAPEFNAGHQHIYAAFGAGRDDNPDKLSAACQFYIVQNPDGLARLDGNYMIYGHVIKGMDVVETIAKLPTNEDDEPLLPVSLKVRVIELNRSQLLSMGVPSAWITP